MEYRGWRAYYVDETRSSTEYDPEDLPDGVLGIVEFLEPPYRKIVSGGDWYWFEDGRWRASDTIWNGWVEKPAENAIRSGALPNNAWKELQLEMIEDRQWP